jgi:hypothetical protein
MIMLVLYRSLLHLYPAAHRREYGEEMLTVFREVHAETWQSGAAARAAFCTREIAGVLSGAVEERLRSIFGFHPWPLFPARRFTVRSEFRFPKATAVLMLLILGGVVLAIEKAKAINASLPNVNPHVGPIQPAHFTFLPVVILAFVFFYAAGLIGWAILFALHRSGMHRLSNLPAALQEK